MIGRHLLADFFEVAPEHLKDLPLLEESLRQAAARCALTPLAPPVLYRFEGGGVTGFILLSESHISIHTYPELGLLAMDVFSCGPANPEAALDVFREALNPGRIWKAIHPRGRDHGG